MAKYKISKENINEFFGLFGKKKKPKDIEDIIKNDPVLQKIDKEIETLNKKATDRIKATDPDFIELLKKHGVDIK